jgi:hypothetical protein
MEENLPEGFVGVHIGAGQHSEVRFLFVFTQLLGHTFECS